ncbi:MAG: NADPH:quinone oxidoreductase family protein [Alphaproteobacteria bacterium]|jgi:NADPH2:quinone reductase|nr:NADPH:quinone oxidoreductase family protein [Alphaproteobacteria bacterium]
MPRAAVCRELGPPTKLRIEEVPRAALGSGEVRIAMAVAGVNFPDLLMVQGGYQLRPPLPFTPGMEGAGRIVECAADVERWRVGDRAIVRLRPGTFAEEVVAPAARLIRVPRGMDDTDAACFTVAFRTAYHGLVDRGRLAAGDVLLVHGAAGGVGLAAVRLGAELGAHVIATAGSEEKCAAAVAEGAAHAIDYRAGNFREAVLALTEGRGADVVFDPVGGDVFDASLRCLAWGGRLLVVGFASGRIPAAPANYPLLKGAAIVGVRAGEHSRRDPAGDRRNLATLTGMAEAGRIRPHISHRLPLERAAEALMLLAERRVIGRAVLVMER